MTEFEYETFVTEATGYLKARIESAKARFGVRRLRRCEYNLFRGEIWWSDSTTPRLRGRVTVVGSVSSKSNTWLWSWANPHFSGVVLGDIVKVREFGEAKAVAKLAGRQWQAGEVDGWEMTALSARLLEAEGAHRVPSENGVLFLLYDRLERIPDDELDHYMPLKRTVAEARYEAVEMLPKPPVASPPLPREKLATVRGGARLGRIYRPWPFATLTLTEEALVLSVFFTTYVLKKDDVARLEPVDGWVSNGVRIVHLDPALNAQTVFWCQGAKALLAEARALGYLVAVEPA